MTKGSQQERLVSAFTTARVKGKCCKLSLSNYWSRAKCYMGDLQPVAPEPHVIS